VSTVRSAVALLTRFPIATADTDASGVAAFGLIGAIVGVAGAIPRDGSTLTTGRAGRPW
jgi:hypothetical protein